MKSEKERSRREFLKILGAGTCGALIHHFATPAHRMMAYGDPLRPQDLGSLPVLVVVNLSGGASYNVAPIYHGAYRDRNPTISYGPENSLPLSSDQGLHPSLTGLKTEFDEGHLALVNMVGYPNENRSHDESTRIWQQGVRSGGGAIGGWGARLTCQMASAFGGVSLAGAMDIIQGDCNPPRSLSNLQNMGEDNFWGGSDGNLWMRTTRTNLLMDSPAATCETQQYVRDSMTKLQSNLEVLRQYSNTTLPVTFPNTGFGNACRDAARLIQAGPALNVQFIALNQGGYDTHSGERTRLTQLLTELNGGLTALIAAAKAMGRYQDLVIITMSEFCRTHENSSQGTDHGHAAPLLVAGGGVIGGIKTPGPTPEETQSGDFYRMYHTDFREVFREAIVAMRYNPGPVFPEAYQQTPLGIF